MASLYRLELELSIDDENKLVYEYKLYDYIILDVKSDLLIIYKDEKKEKIYKKDIGIAKIKNEQLKSIVVYAYVWTEVVEEVKLSLKRHIEEILEKESRILNFLKAIMNSKEPKLNLNKN